MSMTDPIADVLTRVRNALRIYRTTVDVPKSNKIKGVLDAMKREGYISTVEEVDGMASQGMYRVGLKYGLDDEQVINKIERVSTPGCRNYTSIDDLRPVINGLGIHILSTSKGVLSDREARAQHVGGEVLCKIW